MDDFSTNRHSFKFHVQHVSRHPDLYFADGNLAVLANDVYFVVHRGVLARHSEPLADAIREIDNDVSHKTLEGHPVLALEENSSELLYLLSAFYDGVSEVDHDCHDFDRVSALLRLSTKYQVQHIRKDIIRGLSLVWPKTLQGWDLREAEATDEAGVYTPRAMYPHPILVINLATETNVPDILPAALYDLSRLTPSEISAGYLPPGSVDRSAIQSLSDTDLLCTLKGREHGSRFLSTFTVNELEGRESSATCVHRNEQDIVRKRICQATYEATTYEVLRDVNSENFQKNCDPLYAIMDADVMCTARRDQTSGTRLSHLHRACEPCRAEFTAAVDAAREEFWHKLPGWFGVEVSSWP